MSLETRRPGGGRGLRRALWSLLLLVAQAGGGCEGSADGPATPQEENLAGRREKMVELQLASRGIRNDRVLAAMRNVLRHRYVPDLDPSRAYDDRPQSIGEGQTISQPYIVALMTELARLDEDSRVLEIGTGSGYQAAILHEVAGEVYSIEIIAGLAQSAKEKLPRLGYGKIRLRHGDGYRGWPDAGPFDAILVTAAPAIVPEPLKQQLAEGGRLIIPVGSGVQELLVFTRTSEGIERDSIIPVLFVPMTGEIQTLDESRR